MAPSKRERERAFVRDVIEDLLELNEEASGLLEETDKLKGAVEGLESYLSDVISCAIESLKLRKMGDRDKVRLYLEAIDTASPSDGIDDLKALLTPFK